MRKKASLNLSINAIVVLILAITMLGLGLTFMRDMFGKVSGQFDQISSGLESEIIEELKSSKSRILLKNAPFNLERGTDKTLYFGLYNNLDGKCNFGTGGEPLETYFFCDQGLIAVPGGPQITLPDGTVTTKFAKVAISTFSKDILNVNEGKALPLKITIDSTAQPDTYSCHMYIGYNQISQAEAGATCGAQQYATGARYYVQEDFFVIVK